MAYEGSGYLFELGGNCCEELDDDGTWEVYKNSHSK